MKNGGMLFNKSSLIQDLPHCTFFMCTSPFVVDRLDWHSRITILGGQSSISYNVFREVFKKEGVTNYLTQDE